MLSAENQHRPSPAATDPDDLRPFLRQLAALSTLPATWAEPDVAPLASKLAEAIEATLHPDLVYVCLNGPRPGPSGEALRLAGRPATPAEAELIQRGLAPCLEAHANGQPQDLRHPAGPGQLRLHIMRLGPDGLEGVIVAGAPRAGFPTEADGLLLTIIANQAASWGRQAQLLAGRHEAEQTLTRLNELAQVFAAELNLDKLVQAVTDAATQLVGAEFGAFFYDVVDHKGESFKLFTLSGAPRAAFEKFPMPRNTPVFEPTFRGAGIVRSGNIREDPRYGRVPPYHGMPSGHLPVTSYLAVPVFSHTGRAIGGLFFGHAQPDQFTEQHEQLLQSLASQAAVAINNAQLYQAEQQARDELEERVEARTADLLRSEARFQLLVNSVQDYAIYMLDPEGVVASWNPGAARIKGYRHEEIIGQNFSRFYTPEDAAAGKPAFGLAQARETGHFEAEGWRVRKDGTRFWANVVITPVRDGAGELIGFAKVTRDLTERRHMEDTLRQSREQLRQLSAHLEEARESERARIAREIHDELGGTLTGLKMDVVQLKRHVSPDVLPRLSAYSQAIDEAVRAVRRIATELRPAVLDDFGLLPALEWQLGEFERRSGLHCQWVCGLASLDVTGDTATAVFRVFQESLTNIARHAQASEVRVSCALENGQLKLTIADNGIGIHREQNQGRHSLGLAGIRERIGLLGGTVDIQGQPGQGTTVQVRVPLPAGA